MKNSEDARAGICPKQLPSPIGADPLAVNLPIPFPGHQLAIFRGDLLGRHRLASANAPFNNTPSYQGIRSSQTTTRNRLPRFFWDTLAFDTNRNNA